MSEVPDPFSGPVAVTADAPGAPDPLGYVCVHSDSFDTPGGYSTKYQGWGDDPYVSVRGMIPGFRTDGLIEGVPDGAYGLTHIRINQPEDAPDLFERRTGDERPDGVAVVYTFERAMGSFTKECATYSDVLDEPVVKEFRTGRGRQERRWYVFVDSVAGGVEHVREHTGLDVSEVFLDE